MTKYRVVLFQTYLRKHITNFGKYLRRFQFIIEKPSSGNFYKALLPSYNEEICRVKTSRINKFRRLFGILNVRIKFNKKADLFFTYGCMLLSNKPYCVYVENGVAIYNYDTGIAKHPVARILFSILIRQKNCKKLIFMSEAGEKSFFSTVPYSRRTRAIARKKSTIIYPLIEEKKGITPKKYRGNIKLLFSGVFYMKGGLELVHAFEKIRELYHNISLTIITPLHTVKETDIATMKRLTGLTLLDATLSETQMNEMYESHDIFMLPTFRDGFGLVLVEAISFGMPIICTDQYATTEVAIHDYNAFVYPDHPLKDYDPKTFQLFGKYYHPKYFYADLFRFQQEGKMKPIENFLFSSIEKFALSQNLLESFSKNSLEIYNQKFHRNIISERIETALLEAISER